MTDKSEKFSNLKTLDPFKVVRIASWRARKLAQGAIPLIEIADGTAKGTQQSLSDIKIALKEIDEQLLDLDKVEEEIIASYKNHMTSDNMSGKAMADGSLQLQQQSKTNEIYDIFMESLSSQEDNGTENKEESSEATYEDIENIED